MKEKITHNIGLKIFSILLAVIIWLIIINLADPVIRRTISGVEVEVINEEVLVENWVYEIVEGKTVDVTLVGKRSMVDSIRKSDLYAYADLANLSVVKATEIKVEIKGNPTNQPEINVNPRMLKVSLEQVSEASFDIRVDTIGKVDEDFYLDDYEPKPSWVQVRGSVSTVERINTVRVEVNVSGRDSNFKDKVEPKAYDENGKLIESNNLTFLVDDKPIETVTVSVKILNKKTIDIMPVISGTPAEGYKISSSEAVPSQIQIAGTAKELGKIDLLKINVDVDQASETKEFDIDSEEILNNLKEYNVRLVEEKQMVTIRVLIESVILQEPRDGEIPPANLPPDETNGGQ